MRILAGALGLCLTAPAAENHLGVTVVPVPVFGADTNAAASGPTPLNMMLTVSVRPGAAITAGGMAVDKAGNIYVSDHGVEPQAGSIIMLPNDGRAPVVIMTRLDRPSDIEMSPDGRSLVIAGPDGKVYAACFGVSVRLHFVSEPMKDPLVFLKTDTGTLVSMLTADGYFHFPSVLVRQQQSWTVTVVIRNGSRTVTRTATLQHSSSDLNGQTILDITI
jgi:hypothetical protein